MREIRRSALVGRPPAALFALINDIESYPQFLPWCTHARVESRSPHEIVATLGVRQGALQGEFTTRNTLEPDRSILMQLVSGPFRTLEGEWRLTPGGSDGLLAVPAMPFSFRDPRTPMAFWPHFRRTLQC